MAVRTRTGGRHRGSRYPVGSKLYLREQRYIREADRYAKVARDLSTFDINVLNTLFEDDFGTVASISEKTGISPAQVSDALTNLRIRGLVKTASQSETISGWKITQKGDNVRMQA